MASNSEFNNLSPEEQEFVKEKKIQDSRTIDEWYEFFNPLALFDKNSDKKRRYGNYVKGLWAFWIGFGLYMGLLFMFTGQEPINFLIAGAVIIISGLLQYWTYRIFEKYELRDIPNLLQGFVVPLLEVLKKNLGGQAKMDLSLDLSKIDELVDVEVVNRTTDPINYLTASVGLPDSEIWTVKMVATGVEQHFYPRYKLNHKVSQEIVCNKSNFQVLDASPFDFTEDQNHFVIRNEQSQQSEMPIELDQGPNLYIIRNKLGAMRKAVQKLD